MEILNELVELLRHIDTSEVQVISVGADEKIQCEKDRFSEFYKGLIKGKWSTEEAIARDFGYESPYEKGFRRLRDGLSERLLNSLIIADSMASNNDVPAPNVNNELLRLWSAAAVLKQRGAGKTYSTVAQKCLEMAIANGNSGMVVEISRQLRLFYQADPSKSQQLRRVKFLFAHYWTEYQAEMEIQHDYFELQDRISGMKGSKKEHAPFAFDLFDKYRDYLETSDNLTIQYYTRMFQFYAGSLACQWKNCLFVIDDALDYYEKCTPDVEKFKQAFLNLKVCCLMMLSRNDEAEILLQSLQTTFKEGSANWFKSRELNLINALYDCQYKKAWEILKSSMGSQQFSQIPELDKESWRLFQGYLNFLLRKGEFTIAEDSDETVRKFRIRKWMNEMPIHSADKRGGNIPVLILQVHFLVLDTLQNPGAFDEIEKRSEALRKYVSRNLEKNADHFRTDCFLSLIQLLPKYMYQQNWAEMLRAAAPILKKMSSVPADMIDAGFEIEIVPYERQWDWIVDILTESTPAMHKLRIVHSSASQSLPLQTGYC